MAKWHGLLTPEKYYHLLGLKTGLAEEKVKEVFEALVDLVDQEFNSVGYAYIPKVAIIKKVVRPERTTPAGYYPCFKEKELDPETGGYRPKMKYYEERVQPERVKIHIRWSAPFLTRLVPKPKGYRNHAKRH
jgi:hypothetical protein